MQGNQEQAMVGLAKTMVGAKNDAGSLNPRDQSPLESLLDRLGDSGPLVEFTDRLARILVSLRGATTSIEGNKKCEEPVGLLGRAAQSAAAREEVLSELHEQICELESLIGV